jgi:hypothetical protein
VLRHPASFAHGSFAFNAHLNADGTPNEANVQSTVTIDRREIVPSYREARDPYHLTRGGALGRVHRGFTLLRLSGRILVPNVGQAAAISDKERAMLAAFDPELCAIDSPSTDGAYAFDFSEPTDDTTTYPTGRIDLRYWARPMSQPTMVEELAEAGVRRYVLGLIAADPRAYERTEQTLALTPASPSGNVVNRGTARAPLKATIVMGGAGASNFTIQRSSVSFVLDLSGMTGGDTVVVVFETCAPYGAGRKITKNGSNAFSLKTSGPATWLDVPPGTTSFAISNHSNVTSCTLGWYSARA